MIYSEAQDIKAKAHALETSIIAIFHRFNILTYKGNLCYAASCETSCPSSHYYSVI